VNLLHEHADGLTLDQIVTHFDRPLPKKPTAGQREKAEYTTLVLRGVLWQVLEKLQQEGEVIAVDGKYKVTLAAGR
jgi:hypothetical protein